MSVKERDRLRVVHQVKEGKLTCREAAELLGISARQVRRSLRRLEEEGDPGLVHRLRNRPSNRKIAEEIRRRVLERIQERYGDFGPTLVSEYLESEDRLQVSRETVRGWMIEGGLWTPHQRRVRHRQWRERKACFGELVQMDMCSSP